MQALCVVLVAVLAVCASAQPVYTALDEYIALPDPTYSYFDTVSSLVWLLNDVEGGSDVCGFGCVREL
jgi:hypothetical protein